MMMNALKWIGLGCVVLPTLLLVGSYLNHRWQALREEEMAYPPPGELVAINGHRRHVYAEGAGNPTLVFLSGSGTTAPTLDFKALYSRLSDTYRVAVVERAGYGWSDDSATPRDIETVLNETRLALQRAGEDPPFVLFPPIPYLVWRRCIGPIAILRRWLPSLVWTRPCRQSTLNCHHPG